jgi:hypothetical protein
MIAKAAGISKHAGRRAEFAGRCRIRQENAVPWEIRRRIERFRAIIKING